MTKTQEVEQALIGCIILNSSVYDVVKSDLKSTDFEEPVNQEIFSRIDELYSQGKPIDIISISQGLSSNQAKYLSECMATIGSSESCPYYTSQVKEYSRQRQLILLGEDIKLKAVEGSSTLIKGIEYKLAELTMTDRGSGEVDTHKLVDDLLDTVKRLKDNPQEVVGISTKIKSLDMKLSGLHPSDLLILAARPACGKSALALQLARNVSESTPVMFFSLEMGADQLMKRVVSAESRVGMGSIMSGRVNDAEMESLEVSAKIIKHLPLYFNDRAAIQLADIRSQLKLHNATNPHIGFLIIDYLQLMSTKKDYASMVAQVTEISRGLKVIAKDFNIPVLALSQLNRSVETRGGRPRLSDLRDSGSIEQDADIVMFLHTEEKEDDYGGKTVELIIEKHRNGPTGVIEFNFDSAKMTFLEIDNVSKW